MDTLKGASVSRSDIEAVYTNIECNNEQVERSIRALNNKVDAFIKEFEVINRQNAGCRIRPHVNSIFFEENPETERDNERGNYQCGGSVALEAIQTDNRG